MEDYSDPFTVAIHADSDVEDLADIAPPIHVSTTFDRSEQDSQVYARRHHVTRRRLESVIGALEGGHAVCYSSGMAAAAALFDWLRPARVVPTDDLYHGTRRLIELGEQRSRWKVVSPAELAAGDLRWVETPSNPRLEITDIGTAARQARDVGAILAVDNTFATPVLQHPLALGADVVLHSTTKFIGGHSDALGGALVTKDETTAEELRRLRTITGAVPGSLEAWLTLRGIRTLPLRVVRQSETAHEIAGWLSGRVSRVFYPWLDSHPGREVATIQMTAGGGVVSFDVESGDAAELLVNRLRVFRPATSLGGVESLAEHRSSVDPHAPPGFVRLSIGLEAVDDLISDLGQAFG